MRNVWAADEVSVGLIREDAIASVRERARIEDVARDVVTLRSAGGGRYKGLCPFHEERSPSFQVDPAKNLWHCFGCGEGGDVISFVRKVDALTFVEAVEKLAGRFGIILQYDDSADGSSDTADTYMLRKKIVNMNVWAAGHFHEQLMALPKNSVAWTFLTEKGFTDADIVEGHVGYSSAGGSDLTDWLKRRHSVSHDDVVAAGLAVEGTSNVYDRFRGRIMWPICDASGAVVGFGGRRLSDKDKGPKYLNTPETPVYKKSQILYGLDLARKHVASDGTLIIVEGYTDVMACRAAGMKTAVATCGTAFGSDHVALLRRIVGDDGQFKGDIVFTFDGDQAGRKAALRSFDFDSRFTNHTYVAVEQSGADPCDVRIARGDKGLRELVDSRVPLYDFVVSLILDQHNLKTPEGRSMALEQVAPIIAKIRNIDVRLGYERVVSERLGLDEARVNQMTRRAPTNQTEQIAHAGSPALVSLGTAEWAERQSLICMAQYPWAVPQWREALDESAFTTPAHSELFTLISAQARNGYPDFGDDNGAREWIARLISAAGDNAKLHAALTSLIVSDLSITESEQSEGKQSSIGIQTYALASYANTMDQDARRLQNRLRVDTSEAISPEDCLDAMDSYAKITLFITDLAESHNQTKKALENRNAGA